MGFTAILLALLSSLTSAAVLPRGQAVSYDGHKLFRVHSGLEPSSVLSQLASISLAPWNDDTAHHADVLVPPDRLDAFEALKLKCHVMQENIGDMMALESASHAQWKRQTDDWYSAYHDYDDHVQYFRDLQARVPDNSEWVSSGTSFEGRDLYGIHLWGASGPNKTAVLYHGTVHAREWITTPVCPQAPYLGEGCC